MPTGAGRTVSVKTLGALHELDAVPDSVSKVPSQTIVT